MVEKSDPLLYESYSRLINSAYPSFLKRLGLNTTALKAEGVTITDSEGKIYIDCTSGYGLLNLGHNHPQITKALIQQLQNNRQFNKPFITEPQVKLAEILADITPGDLSCSFICNSGSEAIDSAIKLARLAQRKPQIIAAHGGFHGYTFGALSVTGIPTFRQAFGPLLPDILHVPFGDLKALEEKITQDTAAVLLEPVQHEAGVALAPTSYFQDVREICDQNNVLLILDEVKTGFGKTGKMFACEHFGIVPDILVLGKSMGGGLIPMGALVGKEKLWRKFSYSFPMSASSYAGNILASTAALETIQILQTSDIIENCAKKGNLFLKSLNEICDKYPGIVTKAAGIGLLIGISAADHRRAFELSREMINQGILIFQAFGNSSVLMIEPPLVISEDQIGLVLAALDRACKKLDENL